MVQLCDINWAGPVTKCPLYANLYKCFVCSYKLHEATTMVVDLVIVDTVCVCACTLL